MRRASPESRPCSSGTRPPARPRATWARAPRQHARPIEEFRERGQDEYVDAASIEAQLIPASPDVVVALLRRHGTRDLSSLAAPAIQLAEDGFPVHPTTVKNVGFGLPMRIVVRLVRPQVSQAIHQGRWWRPLVAGDRGQRPDLAKSFRSLAGAETDCPRIGRIPVTPAS